MEDLANPLPAIVLAEMLGVPTEDHRKLKNWSQDFAEMLGNFQHNPDRAAKLARSLEEMTAYFQVAVRRQGLLPEPPPWDLVERPTAPAAPRPDRAARIGQEPLFPTTGSLPAPSGRIVHT